MIKYKVSRWKPVFKAKALHPHTLQTFTMHSKTLYFVVRQCIERQRERRNSRRHLTPIWGERLQ